MISSFKKQSLNFFNYREFLSKQYMFKVKKDQLIQKDYDEKPQLYPSLFSSLFLLFNSFNICVIIFLFQNNMLSVGCLDISFNLALFHFLSSLPHKLFLAAHYQNYLLICIFTMPRWMQLNLNMYHLAIIKCLSYLLTLPSQLSFWCFCYDCKFSF